MACIAMNCNKGIARKVNQDACCMMVAKSPFGEVVMVVVCDGVGGLCQGELASAMVVNGFERWFEQDLPAVMRRMRGGFSPEMVRRCWYGLLIGLNKTIRERGAQHEMLMGTTFTGLLWCGSSYVVGHVGDCRAYVVRGGVIRQITDDQTLLARMIAEGIVDEEDSSQTHLQNVILQAVGTESALKPAFYMGRVKRGDVYVICSDGAYKVAGNARIRSAFARADPGDERALRLACDQVIACDLRGGETDNLTIACASVGPSTPVWRGGGRR